MHPGTGTGVVVALIAVCPCMRHASGQTSFPPCHLPRARHVPVLDFFTFLVACHCRPTVGEIPTPHGPIPQPKHQRVRTHTALRPKWGVGTAWIPSSYPTTKVAFGRSSGRMRETVTQPVWAINRRKQDKTKKKATVTKFRPSTSLGICTIRRFVLIPP